MKLHELRRILAESTPRQWARLDSSGPFYRTGWSMSYGGDLPGHDLEVREHPQAAVYRDDVDLTLQWGMPMSAWRDREGQWKFPWADAFMTSTVHPYWVDVFWRGSLVDRYAVIDVDGGHGLVPFPHTAGKAPDWYDAVTEQQVAVVELVGAMEGIDRYVDSYVQRAGFRVVPDED